MEIVRIAPFQKHVHYKSLMLKLIVKLSLHILKDLIISGNSMYPKWFHNDFINHDVWFGTTNANILLYLDKVS